MYQNFFNRSLYIVKGCKDLISEKKYQKIAATHTHLTKKFLTRYKKYKPESQHLKIYAFEKIVKQQKKINQQLLISVNTKNGAILPMPKSFLDAFSGLNWNIAEKISILFFIVSTLLGLFFGISKLAKKIITGLLLSKNLVIKQQNFVYFHDLSKDAIIPYHGGKTYNFLNWYVKNSRIKKSNIAHNCKGLKTFIYKKRKIFYYNPCSPICGFRTNISIIKWGIKSIFLCIVSLYKGEWWQALFFPSIVDAEFAKRQIIHADNYFFHNSCSQKPLWMQSLENKGAVSTFYFYTTNCDYFMSKRKYPFSDSFYSFMRWQKYLVWTNEQKNFLVRGGHTAADVAVTGPIWFQDCEKKIKKLPEKSICIFDVQPRRPRIYSWLGAPLQYFTGKTCISFLEDIFQITRSLNLICFWKSKRILPKNDQKVIDPRYMAFVERALKEKKLLSIPGGVSPFRVIPQTRAVISLPFTSTAVIARHLSKPACYYDPTGLIHKNDRAAHGIPVISGKDELSQWLRKHA